MPILFFSYSHADETLRDELEKHLAMLKRQHLIETWHDRRILAGNDFVGQIDVNLEHADIILLLVSPDFLASAYCYDIEMKRALERHEAGEALVIPVILRPCDWHGAPFGHLQALPKDGQPVRKFADLDDAFLAIVEGIKKVVGQPSSPTPPLSGKQIYTSAAATHTQLPRSSNLRTKKIFTRADEDKFLDETLEYMAKFFEGSLNELEHRNEEIDGRFKRLDANSFAAVAYRGGNPVSRCRIFITSAMLGGGIAYSDNDESNGHSMNESMSVVHDEQMLALRPLNMGGGNAGHLTSEGAAEYYWSRFVQPLQR